MERGRCFLGESERASAYFSRISYMPFSNLKLFFNALIPSFAFGVFGMTIAIKVCPVLWTRGKDLVRKVSKHGSRIYSFGDIVVVFIR